MNVCFHKKIVKKGNINNTFWNTEGQEASIGKSSDWCIILRLMMHYPQTDDALSSDWCINPAFPSQVLLTQGQK